MVQQWFPPEHGQTSWVGPAWSLSAEWLAYLVFPDRGPGRRPGAPRPARPHPVRAGRLSRCCRWSWASPCASDLGGQVWIAAHPVRVRRRDAAVRGCLAAGPDTAGARRLAGYGALATVVADRALALRRARARPSPRGGPVYVVVLFVPLIACPRDRHRTAARPPLDAGTGARRRHLLRPLPGAQPDAQPVPRRHRATPGSSTSPNGPRYYAELAFIPVIVFVGVAALPLLRGAGAQADAPDARRPVLAHAPARCPRRSPTCARKPSMRAALASSWWATALAVPVACC